MSNSISVAIIPGQRHALQQLAHFQSRWSPREASRHYAFEGRCFVLAAGLIMRAKDLPAEFQRPPAVGPDSYLLHGGSAIIGANGRYVVEPCVDQEKTIMAQLDLTAVDEERMTLDVAGHYSRPDIFDLQIRGSGR